MSPTAGTCERPAATGTPSNCDGVYTTGVLKIITPLGADKFFRNSYFYQLFQESVFRFSYFYLYFGSQNRLKIQLSPVIALKTPPKFRLRRAFIFQHFLKYDFFGSFILINFSQNSTPVLLLMEVLFLISRYINIAVTSHKNNRKHSIQRTYGKSLKCP